MKRVLGLSMVLGVAVLLVCTTTAQAAKNKLIKDFSHWVSEPYGTGTPVTLLPDGGNVTIEADGNAGYTWGGLFNNTTKGNAIGMQVTINLSEVSPTSGNVGIGFSNSLGMLGNIRIQSQITYEANNYNQHRFIWRIRVKDTSLANATWSTIAAGTLSDLWVSGYNTGQDITVYFKRVGDKSIAFGIVGTPYKLTWTATAQMTKINYYPEVFGFANNGNNTIKAVIKKVYLLY